METKANVLKYFKFRRIIIPILLGLGVASFLLYRNLTEERFQLTDSTEANYIWSDANADGVADHEEFTLVDEGKGTHIKLTYKDVLKNIRWGPYSLLWIFISIFLMLVRDASYMLRLRILTERKLSWKQCFDTILLWEFASAVTPSVVGGSAVAFFIVNKEGLNLGKSTAIVMITALLDELFYLIMVPVVVIFVSTQNLFPTDTNLALFSSSYGIKGVFISGYIFIFILTSFISYAIFINPRGFKWLLLKIFKLRMLKRWRIGANQMGNDLITTSKEMKKKSVIFWLKAFGATFLSWTARFWVVNSLIMVFIVVDQHFLIYARQLVMWVIILISPTPGSSGIAEFAFTDFFRDFIPLGFSPAIALMWRLVSYYPYLFIGVIILPNWLKRVYKRKQNNKEINEVVVSK